MPHNVSLLLAAILLTATSILGVFSDAAAAAEGAGVAADYFPPPGSGADWQKIEPADAGFDRGG